MPTDLTVILQDRPGELARVGEVVGGAGVSIKGLAAFTVEAQGIVHVLVEDDMVTRARTALEEASMAVVDAREVLLVDIEDRPGSLGELARELAEANVNVDVVYAAFGGVRLAIATDDVLSARSALA
jgi:hypothetical protein